MLASRVPAGLSSGARSCDFHLDFDAFERHLLVLPGADPGVRDARETVVWHQHRERVLPRQPPPRRQQRPPGQYACES